MLRLRLLALALVGLLATSSAVAQFTGPSATGRVTTVQEARNTRLGTYVTVTGNIVAHQRANYFTFRDETGEIRVEIDYSTWQGRAVGPETKVRLLAEVDRGIAGRYLWVKTLELVD